MRHSLQTTSINLFNRAKMPHITSYTRKSVQLFLFHKVSDDTDAQLMRIWKLDATVLYCEQYTHSKFAVYNNIISIRGGFVCSWREEKAQSMVGKDWSPII